MKQKIRARRNGMDPTGQSVWHAVPEGATQTFCGRNVPTWWLVEKDSWVSCRRCLKRM